jgi:hypothetical protein
MSSGVVGKASKSNGLDMDRRTSIFSVKVLMGICTEFFFGVLGKPHRPV